MASPPPHPLWGLGSPLSRRDVESGGGVGWGVTSAAGWRPALQPGRSSWAAERPLDPTPSRSPALPSSPGIAFGPAARGVTRHSLACPRASSGRGSQMPPSPSSGPLPFAARAPRLTVRPSRLRLLLRVSEGLPRRGAAQGAVSGGSRPASARQSPGSAAPNPAVGEAVCRPCRAGALLSLVWNFHPTCTPQAGTGAGGCGSRPRRRNSRSGRVRGDQGAAGLEPSLEADRAFSDPGDSGGECRGREIRGREIR